MKGANLSHTGQKNQHRTFFVLIRDEGDEKFNELVIDFLLVYHLQTLPRRFAVLWIHLARLWTNVAHRRTLEGFLDGFAQGGSSRSTTARHLEHSAAATRLDAQREFTVGLTDVARRFYGILQSVLSHRKRSSGYFDDWTRRFQVRLEVILEQLRVDSGRHGDEMKIFPSSGERSKNHE